MSLSPNAASRAAHAAFDFGVVQSPLDNKVATSSSDIAPRAIIDAPADVALSGVLGDRNETLLHFNTFMAGAFISSSHSSRQRNSQFVLQHFFSRIAAIFLVALLRLQDCMLVCLV